MVNMQHAKWMNGRYENKRMHKHIDNEFKAEGNEKLCMPKNQQLSEKKRNGPNGTKGICVLEREKKKKKEKKGKKQPYSESIYIIYTYIK